MGNMRRIKKKILENYPVRNFRRELRPGECKIETVVTAKRK